MYKPLLLSLALSGVGIAGVGADNEKTAPSDVSTWRWQVSTILEAQRASRGVGATPAETFAQSYERYSVLGRPEATSEDSRR
jgi:hypothetical protein